MSLLGLPIVDYGALPSKYKDIYIYSVWELLQWCAVVPPFKAPPYKGHPSLSNKSCEFESLL